jgi:hypothetical protein
MLWPLSLERVPLHRRIEAVKVMKSVQTAERAAKFRQDPSRYRRELLKAIQSAKHYIEANPEIW